MHSPEPWTWGILLRPETVILIFFPISSHTSYHLHFDLSTQRKAQINVTLLSPYKTSQQTNPSHAQRAVLPDTYSTGWKTGRWNSRSQRPELPYLIGSCYSRLMISTKQERIQFPWCSYCFTCALLGNVSYIQHLKSSHCDLPPIIMQPDVQKTTREKKIQGEEHKMIPLFSPKPWPLSGRQWILYLPWEEVRTTSLLPRGLYTQALQQYRYYTRLLSDQLNAANMHGPLCSELFAPVIPHTSWSNRSPPLRRGIPVPLTQRLCPCTDSDKHQTFHLLTHLFWWIELIGAK